MFPQERTPFPEEIGPNFNSGLCGAPAGDNTAMIGMSQTTTRLYTCAIIRLTLGPSVTD